MSIYLMKGSDILVYSYKKYAELRDKKQMTDYLVSKKTGVSTATLSSWKNGNYIPKLDKIAKIANLFNVGIENFVEKDLKIIN